MNDLFTLLRAIPKPVRWLSVFFILAGGAYALGRLLGLGSRSWLLVLAVLVLCALYGLFEFLRGRGEKKRSREFESGLGLNSRKTEVGKEEVREALSELSEKWTTAVAQLRQAGMSIYDLPWYLLIGEPQSGKSTTLLNSGLEFPVGAEALSGAGGTRNCDWWFAEDAVILDTAGRFTFQEESAPDQQEWSTFLKLLRRHRKYCPINGAIVVIPATSLVEDTPEEQEKKAKNIRQKLLHLQKDLAIRFPIFIVITKADRVLGFTEFFSKLDPEDQRQLFGWSNAGAVDKGWDLKGFSGFFDDIVERVHRLRLRFLKDEDNLPLVDKLFVFPEELEALKEPLAGYLNTIFSSSKFEEPFLFRGFYLTSGIQQGRPIARACRDLLRVTSGDGQGVLEDLEQVFKRSRAFFIRDFYEKKVFPEQGLIARTRAAEKKDRTYRFAMYGLAGLLLATILPLLIVGWVHLYKVVAPVRQDATKADSCLDPKKATPCEVGTAYQLVQTFESDKENVREAKWTMRIFLKSSARNELTEELIPAIQGRLFERNVLGPLLASFEARAQGLPWADHAKDYDSFYQGFSNLLRFRRLTSAVAGEDVSAIRHDLHLAPLLAFAQATPGRDPQNRSFDDWLKSGINFEQADKIFVAAQKRIDLSRLRVPEGAAAHAAFRDYWTINNLARWDAVTDDLLRRYKATSEEMLGLTAPAAPAVVAVAPVAPAVAPGTPGAPPAAAPVATATTAPTSPAAPGAVPVPAPATANPLSGTALATLTHFSDLSSQLGKIWTDGEAHLKTEREEPGATRPGPVTAWEANCRTDYEGLTRIVANLAASGDVAAYCRALPAAWANISQGRQQYAHLLQTKTEGTKTTLSWSPDAGRVKDALVVLGQYASPAAVNADLQTFQQRLAAQIGSQPKIDEIKRTYADQAQRAMVPFSALLALTGQSAAPAPPPAVPAAPGAAPAAPPPSVAAVSPAFRLAEGVQHAKDVSGLALALRLLPPAADFYVSNESFGAGCSACYSQPYADSHVLPANDLLTGVRQGALPAPVDQPEVKTQIDRIKNAEFTYLETFVNQLGGGGGGSGGGGGAGGQSFNVPASAAGARAWRDFTRAIRNWNPVIDRPGGGGGGGAPVDGGGGGAGGLSADAMEHYRAGNELLAPLVVRLHEREQAHTRAVAVAQSRPAEKVSPDLASAADAYKKCVAGLDDDPLHAWRQLALGKDGATLADFHTWTESNRLRGNNTAIRMTQVERTGSRLLAQEIRPAFQNRLGGIWAIAKTLGDRFPFTPRARLQWQSETYRKGPVAPSGPPWGAPARDTAQRSATDSLLLETVDLGSLDRLFFQGGSLDSLFEEFALDPIVDGREKEIDFVGTNRDRLRVLREWQRFVYGDGHSSAVQHVKVKLLAGTSTAPRIFVGERMGQVDLFGPNAVRPSTDAARVRILDLPLQMEDRPVAVVGRNEDKAGGWTGILSLRGGPLKIPYFVHLAADGRPREGGKVWTIRIQLPDYQQPQQRLEGVFELTFERPLPEIVPGASLDGN